MKPQLEAAAAALRHCGPDDFGITLDGRVDLVHTRLSIIDLAGSHQPIVTPGRKLSAVVNGEIYNDIERRHEFIARTGVEPLTHSDSECVLQVYGAEGVNGLRRLNGMFALVIHDCACQRVVAQRFGTRHHALEITPNELLARIPHAIWATDELMRDFAVLPTSLLAEKAGQTLKVIFTGEGGDEAFAGYARFRKRPLQRWLSILMAPVWADCARPGRGPAGRHASGAGCSACSTTTC